MMQLMVVAREREREREELNVVFTSELLLVALEPKELSKAFVQNPKSPP